MSILTELGRRVGAAFDAAGLPASLGEVVVSQRPELAQFQCNGALAGAKQVGRNPRELAEQIAATLTADPDLATVEVAGPGFINLALTDDALASWVGRTAEDPSLGVPPVSDPLTVVVDYAGPNVAKAMHVGHLRATIIGDSIARMFELAGHRVIRDPHFGDWGYQMGLLIAAIEDRSPALPYFDPAVTEFPDTSPVTLEDLQELYPAAAQRAGEDGGFAERARLATVALQNGRPGYLALWRHMKSVSEESQRRDFADLGVHFDLWYGESDVADRLRPLVDDLERRGIADRSEGALVVRVAEPTDNREIPPLILETTVGGFLYSTTDLATIDMRVTDLGADLVLYVVDARQSDHFEQVFRAARKAGLAPDRVGLEHIRFGTMNDEHRRPFKTREGGVVRLRDLIEMVRDAAGRRLAEAEMAAEYPEEERAHIASQVGVAALKFGDLQNNRTSDYLFDLDRFAAFEGKTGPYLQYAAVRISSILRNARDRDIDPGPIVAPTVEAERGLMLALLRFPDVLDRSVQLRAPNHVAEYAFELAGAFNRFYEACHILGEDDSDRRASWLRLADLTRRVIVTCLDLLGIEVPERM
jgi:arginyl-tRNA synthetase